MATDGESGFAPGEIAKKDFPSTFRGYDQDKVRDYLRRLSFFLEQNGSATSAAENASSDGLEAENRALKRQVRQLEMRTKGATGGSEGDTVFELLGNETTRILETARSAATDIVKRAEERAALLEETSENEATSLRREAQQLLSAKQAEAAGLTAKIAEDAKRHAERLIADGENKHKRSLAESSRILAEAQDRADFERASSESEAKDIVAEASKRREEILTDLVERRREGHHQLNQLASARNGLVRSLTTTNTELATLLEALSQKIELTASESHVKTVESKLDEVQVLARELDGDRSSKRPSRDRRRAAVDLIDDTDLVELKLEDLPHIGSVEFAATQHIDEPSAGFGTSDQDPEIEVLLERGRQLELDDDTVPADVPSNLPDLAAVAERSRSSRPALDSETLDPDPLDPDTLDSGISLEEDASLLEHGSSDGQPDFAEASTESVGTSNEGLPGAGEHEPDVDLAAESNSPFNSEIGVDEDLSKEIPLLVYTNGVAESVLGDKARDGKFDGELAGEFIARDVAITRFGPALRRRMRRALNDDQSDVLNRLQSTGQRRKKSVSPNDLPSLDEQLKMYVDPLEDGLVDLASAGLAAGGGEVLPTETLHQLSLQVAKHMVQNLRTPSVELLENSLDGDNEALHDPIRDLYRSVRSNVLEAVIEDAINEAFSLGLFSAFRNSMDLFWVLDPRCEPSPLCEINAAATGITKSEPFPSGHTRPLAMPGCRCLVLAESKD